MHEVVMIPLKVSQSLALTPLERLHILIHLTIRNLKLFLVISVHEDPHFFRFFLRHVLMHGFFLEVILDFFGSCQIFFHRVYSVVHAVFGLLVGKRARQFHIDATPLVSKVRRALSVPRLTADRFRALR